MSRVVVLSAISGKLLGSSIGPSRRAFLGQSIHAVEEFGSNCCDLVELLPDGKAINWRIFHAFDEVIALWRQSIDAPSALAERRQRPYIVKLEEKIADQEAGLETKDARLAELHEVLESKQRRIDGMMNAGKAQEDKIALLVDQSIQAKARIAELEEKIPRHDD